MLKKISRLVLGLIVCAGSACVSPTHASSALSPPASQSPVVITYIQSTGPTGNREELIVIHNNSGRHINVTNWCLANKSLVRFACFVPRQSVFGGWLIHVLPPYGSATIASAEYIAARSLTQYDAAIVYATNTQQYGYIISGNDVITLVDNKDEVADSYAWSNAAPSGKAWVRKQLLSTPTIYTAGNSAADWSSPIPFIAHPISALQLWSTYRDVEYEIEPGDDEEAEDGNGDSDNTGGNGDNTGNTGNENDGSEGDEDNIPTADATPLSPTAPISITELLPNPAGADAGKEYIELYNADDTTTYLLDGLRLRVGKDTPKWYQFPTGMHIAPRQYLVITHSNMNFTLPNTQGAVQLYYGDSPLGAVVEYASPKDDYAWALVDSPSGKTWQYIALLTPGKANPSEAVLKEAAKSATANNTASTKQPSPCAANQYRNPETGKCKLLGASEKTPTPCKPGQERNPETNRCRTIATAKELTPCKEGQERNPETNRCRNSSKMSNAGHDVKGIATKASAGPSWYYWAAIIGVVMLVLGYAAWEWRAEVSAVGWRIRRRILGLFKKDPS